MGTRGGMSFGGGARKLDLEESDPGEPLESRCLSSRFLLSDPEGDLLLCLLSACPGESDLGGFGDDLEPRLEELFPSLEDFSIGGMRDLDGVVSFPILLQVWAKSARGDFLASNCNKKIRSQIIELSATVFLRRV